MDHAQHLDAEQLAAFMDGSLSRAERAAVEAHAADCGQCLQLLAAMVRTEPVVPARAWRLPAALRWAIPLAAAATALALWVNVDRGARVSQAPAAPASRIDAVAPSPAAAANEQKAPAVASNPQEQAASRQSAPQARSAAGSTVKDAAKPAAPASEAPRETFQPLADRDQERRAEAGAPARLEAVVPRVQEPAALPSATPAAVPSAPSFRVSDSAAARKAPSLPLDIVSPNPMVRWRVSASSVQRSTDGGQTWGAPFAITADIVAGSSASPDVAWLAGRGGAVLRTTDGTQWQRVTFPQPVDLRGIRALSDREAEVTLPDGRVFRTTDGGQTWSLQEP